MKVGEIKNGTEVLISENALNNHVLITGLSGSGKSVRIREMIADAVENGTTVLVFDINGTDYLQCTNKIKCISAIRNGIPLNFLKAGMQTEEAEANRGYVMCIVDLLSKVYRLGSVQTTILREAVFYAMEHNEEYDSEIDSLQAGLEYQNSVQSVNVADKMWSFLNTGILKRGQLLLEEGFANVLSFEKIAPSLQRVVIELILSVLWREVQTEGNSSKTLTIVIDEFQNLSLHKDSVLVQMLKEARKYGINLILSTQSIADCSKELEVALGQAATQLYFRQEPSSVETVLKKIDPKKSIFWKKALMKLKRGESIAKGDFCIQGEEIDGPIIIKSAYRENRRANYDS